MGVDRGKSYNYKYSVLGAFCVLYSLDFVVRLDDVRPTNRSDLL